MCYMRADPLPVCCVLCLLLCVSLCVCVLVCLFGCLCLSVCFVHVYTWISTLVDIHIVEACYHPEVDHPSMGMGQLHRGSASSMGTGHQGV